MELQREADRLLLSRYVPPAVLINHQLEILQTRGHTASFLELPPGKASLNLLKMARPGLLFELRSAIEEAQEKGFEAIRQEVRVEEDGQGKTVTIRVIPFKVPSQRENSFLIIFESTSSGENRLPAPGTSNIRQFPGPGADRDRGTVSTQQTDHPFGAGIGRNQRIFAVNHRVARGDERGAAVGK